MKRKLVDVFVETLEDDRVLVSGGALKPAIVWIPTERETFHHNGEVFVYLRTSDQGLSMLAGVPLHNNKFLEDLVEGRKKACNAAIFETLNRL